MRFKKSNEFSTIRWPCWDQTVDTKADRLQAEEPSTTVRRRPLQAIGHGVFVKNRTEVLLRIRRLYLTLHI
jgi:hypothetical protein